MKRILVFIALFVLAMQIVGAEITVLGRTVDQENFFFQEDITFYSCFEGKDVQNQINCLNSPTKILPGYKWNKLCTISSISLEDLSCKDVEIKAVDKNTNEILETIDIDLQKLVPIKDSVLGTQNSDGSWDTPGETAFNIWILWQFGTIYKDQIDKGLKWLKKVRLNNNKCWIEPYSDIEKCSLRETTKVLAYLKLAGFDEALRVVHDGQAWLDTQQNYIDNSKWKLYVSSSSTTNCTYTYDSVTRFTLGEDEETEYEITPKARQKVNLTCEDSVWAIIMKNNGKVVYDSHDYEFSYYINGGCWNGDSWEACDYKSSLYATIATLNTERRDAGKAYLESILEKDRIIGKYLPSNDRIVDSALYLSYIDYNPSIRSFLVFNQNNDGSWSDENSTSDIALETIYPTLAFEGKQFKPNQESSQDARNWLKSNTPFNGWRNIEKDALNYLILNDTIPSFITSYPKIIYFNNTDSMTVTLINPTDYYLDNINISFLEKEKAYFDIQKKITIDKQNRYDLVLKQKSKKDGLYYDQLIIIDINKTLKKIPVIIQNNPYIDISYPKRINVINDTRTIDFVVDKSASEFDCTLNSDNNLLTLANSKVKSNKMLITVLLEGISRRKIDYSGMLDCKSELLTSSFPVNLQIEQFPIFPLATFKHIKIDKRSDIPKITLKNLLEEGLNVSLSFKTDLPFHTFEKTKIELGPNEKVKVKILQNVPFEINYSVSNMVIVNVLDYDKAFPLSINLTDDDFSTPGGGLIKGIITYSIIFIIVAGLGYGGYLLFMKFKGKTNIKKLKEKIKKPKKGENNSQSKDQSPNEAPARRDIMDKEELDLIRVIDKLNQNMSKDSTEITKQLTAKGFSEEKIKYALEKIKK